MEFSVLQWNVWYREDIRHVAAFLREHPADIICLQELTIDDPDQPVADTPAFIASELDYHYFHRALPIENPDGTMSTFVNAVFTRLPIVSKRAVWTNEPSTGGGYGDEYRAYVETTMQLGKHKLSVGTTHMSYTHGFEQTPQKQAETDRLLDAVGHHRRHFVFTGDLNATPGSYTIEQLSRRLELAGPPLDRPTWTTKPFSYRGFETNTLDWRLDYIFKTPDIRTKSATILDTPYSDHLPVIARLELIGN